MQEAAVVTGTRGRRRQFEVWRHGFVARQAVLFDFDRYGFDAFLSELERKRNLPRLNRHTGVFRDKLLSYLFFREIGLPTPAVFAFVDDGRPTFLRGQDVGGGIAGLLRRHGKLVVKPRDGAHGAGIRVLEDRDGRTLVNGAEVTDVDSVVRDRTIVSEFVEQHEYARRIFGGSPNTLRVIGVRDHRTGEPFVAMASHRFGSERSQPVDNTERGGLTAGIDLATGTLGRLAAMPGAYLEPRQPLTWLDHHPDTGTRVPGTVVPRWHEVVRELNRTMAALPECSWLGWDVVVTQDGFSVIEGNTGPGISFQVHGPLLGDERVRALFEARGVLSRLVRPRPRRERARTTPVGSGATRAPRPAALTSFARRGASAPEREIARAT